MKYIKKQKHLNDDGEARQFKINIVDIAVILALILLILLAIEYFTSFSIFGIGGDKVPLSYSIEFENVNADMANSIRKGDVAVGIDDSTSLGRVTNVEIQPAERYVYNPETGKIVSKELPADAEGNKPVKIVITLDTDAIYKKGNGYTVNGNRISVGSPLNVSFKGFSGTGNCIAVHNKHPEVKTDE